MEQRRHYRVREGWSSGGVALSARGSSWRGRLRDAAAGGVAVELTAGAALAPPPGAPATLRLEDLAPAGATVRAVVRHARDAEGKRICGIEFLEPPAVASVLPPDGFSLLNRRRWRRTAVRSRPEALVWGPEAADRTPGAGNRARLLTISAGGCALALANGRTPVAGERLVLRLGLPPPDGQLDLVGVVRTVVPDGWIGVEFDAGASRAFAAQQRRIARYVTREESAAAR